MNEYNSLQIQTFYKLLTIYTKVQTGHTVDLIHVGRGVAVFTIRDEEIHQYENELKFFKERAFPFATRQTLHVGSVRGMNLAKQEVRQNFLNRNKWSVGSIQYSPSSANGMSLNVNRQEAFVGSTERYMRDQEFGATKRSEAIPTAYAANQEGTRTKLPTSARSFRKIRLRKGSRKGTNQKQKNIAAAHDAVRTGQRFVYMEFGKKKGIFRVIGGSRRTKKGMPKGMRLRMVYDVTHRQITIAPTAWLSPAVAKVRGEMGGIHRDSLLFQLRRHNILGYGAS